MTGLPIQHDPNAALESDAARRMSDAVNVHLAAIGTEALGKWVACRLSDGVSDGVLYDTKEDAIGHQLHEQLCAYVYITVGGMTAKQAANYLRFTRQCYDNGIRIINNVDGRGHASHVNVPIDYRPDLRREGPTRRAITRGLYVP